MRTAVLILCATATVGVLVQCGGSSSSPPTTPTPTPTPAVVSTPTPTPGIALPAGMVCDPTPPPLYGIQVRPHGGNADRTVLDATPVVINVDSYCERVVGMSGKFCGTRLEGDPQRGACDYLAVGKAQDTGRWGPTWYYNNQLCDGANFGNCANNSNDQFLVNAKAPGLFEACAAPNVPIAAPDGSACGGCTFDTSGNCAK